jgi:hypothetical protein
MTLPIVQFTFDSATTIECVTWVAKNVVNGEIVTEASADIPGSIRVAARVAEGISKAIFSDEKLFGAEAESANAAYAELGEKFGINRDLFGGPLLNIGLKLLLESLLKAIAQNFATTAAERSEAGCHCDDDCDSEDSCGSSSEVA